ncbi:carbohydrate ABC transporter permease [Nocardioides cavernaquae]|uniref:Carbohydrate ABC transporter permease n=1 Tax=Nocardioides cavernaquae TaxID=2321396 RepID=A0A3A5HD15_9ACTN|nr:carbohydrate ABC transporter permease [Nocardioides cavernaquae]RJS45920.1 carbohydrate ABC transporter permease [Nocardioides cavernaquae]
MALATPVSGGRRVRPAEPVVPSRPPRPRRRSLAQQMSTTLVWLIVAVQLYPLVWLIVTSLRPAEEFASGNAFGMPRGFTLDNFSRAFEMADLGRYVLNSAIVTGVSSVLIVALGMSGAYAISVLGFRGSRVVLGIFLLGIIVPVQVALVPLFINYAKVGLLNTYASMILPLVGFALPTSVYLFSAFFHYIPRETYEAASLDGAGPYRVFFTITMPLSVNTVITVVFVNGIFIWNDFIFANTFVFDESRKTIPLGLQNYVGAMGSVDWTATFAAVCVTITPLLLVFLVLNRAIVYGLESGGNKG